MKPYIAATITKEQLKKATNNLDCIPTAHHIYDHNSFKYTLEVKYCHSRNHDFLIFCTFATLFLSASLLFAHSFFIVSTHLISNNGSVRQTLILDTKDNYMKLKKLFFNTFLITSLLPLSILAKADENRQRNHSGPPQEAFDACLE
tara:strand:- start:11877 stop:12314 length:438 start_codon:yes stop_codon:yes gene_type:complete